MCAFRYFKLGLSKSKAILVDSRILGDMLSTVPLKAIKIALYRHSETMYKCVWYVAPGAHESEAPSPHPHLHLYNMCIVNKEGNLPDACVVGEHIRHKIFSCLIMCLQYVHVVNVNIMYNYMWCNCERVAPCGAWCHTPMCPTYEHFTHYCPHRTSA